MKSLLRPFAIALSAAIIPGPAAASPENWCDNNRGTYATSYDICVAAASEDDAECQDAGLSGEQYQNCRRNLLMMRSMTGTPPGDIAIGDCRLPGGALISMNVKTCKAQGGSVEY